MISSDAWPPAKRLWGRRTLSQICVLRSCTLKYIQVAHCPRCYPGLQYIIVNRRPRRVERATNNSKQAQTHGWAADPYKNLKLKIIAHHLIWSCEPITTENVETPGFSAEPEATDSEGEHYFQNKALITSWEREASGEERCDGNREISSVVWLTIWVAPSTRAEGVGLLDVLSESGTVRGGDRWICDELS